MRGVDEKGIFSHVMAPNSRRCLCWLLVAQGLACLEERVAGRPLAAMAEFGVWREL